MYRKLVEDMQKWKERPGRKPLILRGARQVGKTWVMREFGRRAYAQTVYINFDNNPRMKELFEGDLDVERLVRGLELYSGVNIDPARTLLIFDEIQEVPRALSSLKYFNENAPEYHILCAGSLLGIALHPGTSFPVGKVEFLDLFPLSFGEFLLALGKEGFVEALEKGDFDMVRLFKGEYTELLKSYYIVGGMPEAVESFSRLRDWGEVRAIQRRILDAYEQDFSKHAPPVLVPKLRMIWNSIPQQLSRENRKFLYGLIREGARAKDYELALLWLSDCGLVHQVRRISAPHIPLRAYEDYRAFKLFLVDLGLLAALGGIRPEILLDGHALFREFKGALTEQFVLQELKTRRDTGVWYWSSDKGLAELDFILDAPGGEAIPLEVKAELNLQAKSLKSYRERFHPALSLRTSLADYRVQGGAEALADIPLYGIGMVDIQYIRNSLSKDAP
jgi:predicted AAA+ superfamily ATPase